VKTRVQKVSTQSVEEAAARIRAGEVVAFPTETVYGLGANALDPAAVAKIFLAKGRPSDNPLIVHIASKEQLHLLIADMPNGAEELMSAFWPGPLTLIFPKSVLVPDIITAGGETVAIRWPSHPVALELIRQSGVPIAAPSANLSGKPSPTKAEHVLEDLDGRIPLILDGGQTDIGLESTVVDLTGSAPTLLRPGKITAVQLEQVLGKKLSSGKASEGTLRSPGMKYRHYAPKAKVLLFSELTTLKFHEGLRSALVSLTALPAQPVQIQRDFAGNQNLFALELFSTLRALDGQNVEVIYIEKIASAGLGQAIMDRLNRAAEE